MSKKRPYSSLGTTTKVQRIATSFPLRDEDGGLAPLSDLAPTRHPLTANITLLDGDVSQSRLQTLVNTVNCVGVMGAGVAKAFREKFPGMFNDYALRCRRRTVKLGQPYVFRTLFQTIVNFPTKQHWRDHSQLSTIEVGLLYLVEHVRDWHITSMALPALGCNNGGLDWRDVLPMLCRHLDPLGIPIHLYRPTQLANTPFEPISIPPPPAPLLCSPLLCPVNQSVLLPPLPPPLLTTIWQWMQGIACLLTDVYLLPTEVVSSVLEYALVADMQDHQDDPVTKGYRHVHTKPLGSV